MAFTILWNGVNWEGGGGKRWGEGLSRRAWG